MLGYYDIWILPIKISNFLHIAIFVYICIYIHMYNVETKTIEERDSDREESYKIDSNVA
jgi:hypothetical protein